jgi:hypothetical protein
MFALGKANVGFQSRGWSVERRKQLGLAGVEAGHIALPFASSSISLSR